jgi:hypothetical protein
MSAPTTLRGKVVIAYPGYVVIEVVHSDALTIADPHLVWPLAYVGQLKEGQEVEVTVEGK